jgi:hypothetical protein
VVTNDALVITLSVLALFLFLWAERARQQGLTRRRSWLMLGTGVTLGLAAITKYDSLPLAGLLLLLSAVPGVRRPKLLVDTALAVTGALAVSLWWFVRNEIVYGQFLASRATLAYLKAWLPPLVRPVPWTNAQRFLHFVPSHLFESVWYDGGWNQFILPKWMNVALWTFAALSTISTIVTVALRRKRASVLPSASPLALAAVLGSILAGLAAVLIVAQTTAQAEGRVGFVGLAGFAVVLVLGTELSPRRRGWPAMLVFAWPVALLAVNFYVLANFLVPFGGL